MAACTGPWIHAQEPVAAQPSVHRSPLIQWKYGWEDGNRANTIGSARNKEPLPVGSSYLTTGYYPYQIAHAYRFDLLPTNADGTGQTIAIIDAYGSPNIQGDLDIFCDQFRLPKTTVQVFYPTGEPTNQDSDWASETTLDVEWAHAMAPGATIDLVVASDDSDTNTDLAVSYAVTNLNAKIISMSYGETEYPHEIEEDSYFQAPDTVFLAASGDNMDVCYPACSTNVVAVGGTTLMMHSPAGDFTESAWSGTGGGISRYEALPPYQFGINVNAGRGVPDVSYDADPYTGVAVYFTDPTLSNSLGSWIVVGGTSAAAPQWAALLARRASLGYTNGSFLPLIYSKQVYTNGTSWPLKDVTGGAARYRATVGYDLATGLGTPFADQVAVLTPSLKDPAQTLSEFPEIPTRNCGQSFTITPPTASSGLTATVSVLSGPAVITNNTVTPTAVGIVVLEANQAGNFYFYPAPAVLTSFEVAKGPQTIQGFASITNVPVGSAPFTITPPTASSGLPVTVTVSGPAKFNPHTSTITLTGKSGTVVLAANQRGNADYYAAKQVTTSFQVVKQ